MFEQISKINNHCIPYSTKHLWSKTFTVRLYTLRVFMEKLLQLHQKLPYSCAFIRKFVENSHSSPKTVNDLSFKCYVCFTVFGHNKLHVALITEAAWQCGTVYIKKIYKGKSCKYVRNLTITKAFLQNPFTISYTSINLKGATKLFLLNFSYPTVDINIQNFCPPKLFTYRKRQKVGERKIEHEKKFLWFTGFIQMQENFLGFTSSVLKVLSLLEVLTGKTFAIHRKSMKLFFCVALSFIVCNNLHTM